MAILMFHSVGCENENWYRKWLSVSLDHFETFCKFLIKNDYKTVFLDDWFKNPDTKKQIVLTFDDGYLDNWVYVYPILKKYNLKGTIFVNPEFVDPSNNLRKNLDDVWEKRVSIKDLKPLGFANWIELKTMNDSKHIDIQSHSMSHNFYYHSGKIKDIYLGQPQYDWMAWNSRPDRKPFYITEDQKNYVPFGMPIFEFNRALGLRRYFPNEEFIKESIKLFKKNSKEKNTKDLLRELQDKLTSLTGTFETDDDMKKRYRYELFESKRIIEEKLNKTVNYLCWPGGGYNDLSVELSIRAGYKASTGPSKGLTSQLNSDYKRFSRHSMTSFIETTNNNYYANYKNHLVNLFKSHKGNIVNKNIYRAHKLFFLILEKLKI